VESDRRVAVRKLSLALLMFTKMVHATLQKDLNHSKNFVRWALKIKE
jgi:hypothetical protein